MCTTRKNQWSRRLRLGEGKSTDDEIQRKLDQVFADGQPDRSSEQVKSQANSLNSFNSLQSSIFSTRSTIRLDSTLRGEIKQGLDNGTCWADILMTVTVSPRSDMYNRVPRSTDWLDSFWRYASALDQTGHEGWLSQMCQA